MMNILYDFITNTLNGEVANINKEAVALWIRHLPRSLRILGLNPTRVMTMIPHMTPVLVNVPGSGLESDLNKL